VCRLLTVSLWVMRSSGPTAIWRIADHPLSRMHPLARTVAGLSGRKFFHQIRHHSSFVLRQRQPYHRITFHGSIFSTKQEHRDCFTTERLSS
jgi:hypothetical protein